MLNRRNKSAKNTLSISAADSGIPQLDLTE